MTITDLPLFARAATPPPSGSGELRTVLTELRAGDWLTARELTRRTGYSDRMLRSIANERDGRIISGQSGYKLTRQATLDEINHAADWLLSQARKMKERAFAIQRHKHQSQ